MGIWKYASLKSMDVTHSPTWREVLMVSTGCWVWVPKIAGCKTPVNLDCPPVRLHFCLSADTVPLKEGLFGWIVVVAYYSR